MSKALVVALSTCDTGKWLSLSKWANGTAVMALDQHSSSFHYESSGNVGQQNCETSAVIHALRQSQRRLTTEQKADLGQRYQNGATVSQLAKEFGLDRRTVSKLLKIAGVAIRFRTPTTAAVTLAANLFSRGKSVALTASSLEFRDNTIHTLGQALTSQPRND